MALSITATFTSDNQSPGYEIYVSDLLTVSGYYNYTVTRVSDSTYATGPVRNMDSITITTNNDTQYDYEFSFLESFYYQVDVMSINGSVLDTATTSSISGRDAVSDLTTSYGSYWPQVLIRSIQDKDINQIVQISEFNTWSVPGRTLANLNVLGNANPIVVTDQMGGRTGTFKILQTKPTSGTGVSYPNDRDSLESLLYYNDTFMFQCLYYSPMFRDMYFKITNVNVNRINPIQYWTSSAQATSGHILEYEVTFQEVDQPVTSSVRDRLLTWGNIESGYATWQDVKDNNSTWLDILNIT